jgi:hypothetical protein
MSGMAHETVSSGPGRAACFNRPDRLWSLGRQSSYAERGWSDLLLLPMAGAVAPTPPERPCEPRHLVGGQGDDLEDPAVIIPEPLRRSRSGEVMQARIESAFERLGMRMMSEHPEGAVVECPEITAHT